MLPVEPFAHLFLLPRQLRMHFLATSLTVAALIAHALLGCCWHHAHVEAPSSSTTEATIKPVVHGDHVHFHASSESDHESTPPDHEHDRQGCDDGACTFAAANRTSDVNISIAAACQGADAFVPCFLPTGADQLQHSFEAHRRPPDLTARHCALYLSLRTLRI
jgi:hypothetical protein